jgi:NAD(P)-dependent dehydrogenase (short-subunit alcohol dehydrogenase family)
MIAFTEQLALHNAPYGIRANCILDTPMAIDTRARASPRSATPGCGCAWPGMNSDCT